MVVEFAQEAVRGPIDPTHERLPQVVIPRRLLTTGAEPVGLEVFRTEAARDRDRGPALVDLGGAPDVERARLERLGKPTPFVDGQIAAVAHVNQLTLVTLNVKDFTRFKGIEVENWSKRGS